MKEVLQLIFGNALLKDLTEKGVEEIADRLVNDYRAEIMAAYRTAQDEGHPNPVLYACRRMLRAMLNKLLV